MVEPLSTTGQTGKTALGDFLHLRQGILWRSLHATPVFYMKNNPRFGGRQSKPFCYTSAVIGVCVF